MSIQLSQVVPFGRSMHEYQSMFNLTGDDLTRSILGCGDGPASFNAEMTELGHRVVSCDPLYAFSGAEISRRFEESVEDVIAQVWKKVENYVWTYHRNPDDLKQHRRKVMRQFLLDYETGRVQGRYVLGELPCLPFRDREFCLALCSHFLLLYSELFDFDFHLQSIREMLRVADEVRIFPLTGLDCELLPHLDGIVTKLREENFRVEILKASWQLQKNGDSFMKVSR